MNMEPIRLKVTGQSITLCSMPRLVARSAGVYRVAFSFDEAWAGRAKAAVFHSGGIARERMLTENSCVIPSEVLLPGQALRIGVYGVLEGDFLPTVWAEPVTVEPGVFQSETAGEESPSLATQILSILGAVDELKTLDKRSLVAAINEVREFGGGDVGIGVSGAEIDGQGHMLLTLSNGMVLDAGYCVGPAGETGAQGPAGVQGEPGTDGYIPVKGVDYFTEADKANIVQSVLAGLPSGEEVPEYWFSSLQAGVSVIHSAVEAAGRNQASFLFYTDTAFENGPQKTPALLKYLYRNTPVSRVVFGGDIFPEGGSKAAVYDWRLAVRDLPDHHSVPGDRDRTALEGNALYGCILAPEEDGETVWGEGAYYYTDATAGQVRYLYLDNADAGQLAFLTEALVSTPAGWRIVAIAHKWADWDTDTGTTAVLTEEASAVLALFDQYNARQGDFSGCGGKVAFCVGGHLDSDLDLASENGIPVLLMAADYPGPDALGTDGEGAVSAIIGDFDAGKVSVVRIGRGESREIALPNNTVESISIVSGGIAQLEFQTLSAGWNAEKAGGNGMTVTQAEGYLSCQGTVSGYGMVYFSGIDLTDMDSVTVSGTFLSTSSSAEQCILGVWSSLGTYLSENIAASVLLGDTGCTVDVSGLSGTYIVGITSVYNMEQQITELTAQSA